MPGGTSPAIGLVHGLALFGALVVIRTLFGAMFISEQPAFGAVYFIAPFLWCVLLSIVTGHWLNKRGASLTVPFLTTLTCLLLLRLNVRMHHSIFDTATVIDLPTIMVLGGDLLGVALGWVISAFLAKFSLVKRESS